MMKRLFLSFSFNEQDRALAAQIDRLLASHDLQVVTGARLGGAALTPAIQQKIEQCDGLVALLTRRDQLVDGSWTTSDWLRDELNYARARGKQAIALLEEGVNVGGAYGENERIPFQRESLLDACLTLSETVSLWKRQAGRQRKVQILPTTLAQQAALAKGDVQCECRFLIEGETTAWSKVTPILEQGGTYLYINGVQDEAMIQLSIKIGQAEWLSGATNQWLAVELIAAGGNN
jgi:hypothetical protein